MGRTMNSTDNTRSFRVNRGIYGIGSATRPGSVRREKRRRFGVPRSDVGWHLRARRQVPRSSTMAQPGSGTRVQAGDRRSERHRSELLSGLYESAEIPAPVVMIPDEQAY